MLGFFVFLGLAVLACSFVKQKDDHVDLNAKTCIWNSDCEADECCQKINEVKIISRKRAAKVSGQLRSHRKNKTGTCQKYTLDGEVCGTFDAANGHCGCRPGSTCQQVKSSKLRNPRKVAISKSRNSRMVAFPDDSSDWQQVCRVASPTESEAKVKVCSSSSDCLPDECCQKPNKIQMASRKREATRVLVTVATETKTGTCQKNTRPGEFCDPFAKMNGFCGCQSGTWCTGREVPAKTAGTRGVTPTAPGPDNVPVQLSRRRRDVMSARPGYVWVHTCTSTSTAGGDV